MALATIRSWIFRAGAAITAAVSIAVFSSFFVRESSPLNALAMVTIVGAPFAYWIAWAWSGSRLAKIAAPVLFIVAVAPATFGWIGFLYLPGMVGIIIGSPGKLPNHSHRSTAA